MKKKGFGLLEVLVSSSLLLLALGGTAQLLMLSLSAKRNADFCLAAARCASARLEYLKSLPFDSPELQPGATASLLPDTALRRNLSVSCAIEDIEPSMKRVTLQVSDGNSPRKKQAFCLVLCRDLEF